MRCAALAAVGSGAELSYPSIVLFLSIRSQYGERMKRLIFALLLTETLLSACIAAPGNTTLEPAPTETSLPSMPSDTAAAPNPKLPAASFDAQPYVNETAGFALDIPAGGPSMRW